MTGAGSGIGRAVAERLVAEGGTVAALDISGDALATAVEAINGGSGGSRVRAARVELPLRSNAT